MTFYIYKKKWDLRKNSQAVKKVQPFNAWIKKSCEIKGGGQEMTTSC